MALCNNEREASVLGNIYIEREREEEMKRAETGNVDVVLIRGFMFVRLIMKIEPAVP